MNEGLFKKHIQQLLAYTDTKKKISLFLEEKTGIHIEDSEITVSRKNITLSTSSVKKAALLQKGSKEALQSIGYILNN